MSEARRQAAAQQAARRRNLLIGVAVAAVSLVVVVVTIGALGDDPGSGGGGGAGTVRVSMTEFAFSPDPIVLQAGPDAALEVVNDGATGHDLVIGGLGKGTPDLPPGDSMVLDLSGQPAGTYRVVCDLPGHTEAGMVTELVLK